MQKPPISFPHRRASRAAAASSAKSPWPGLALAPALLLASGAAEARNACGTELDALALPADATEVLRDARVMLGGLPMCTLAYTTETGVSEVIARYRAHWRHHPGVLQADDSTGDGRSDTLWQASDRFSRRLAVRTSGTRQAVMISLMPLDEDNVSAPRPYLPLPAEFRVDFQSRNAAGASVRARTGLALGAAASALARTLAEAGWQTATTDWPDHPERRRLVLHRGEQTLEANLLERSGQTLLLVQRTGSATTP